MSWPTILHEAKRILLRTKTPATRPTILPNWYDRKHRIHFPVLLDERNKAILLSRRLITTTTPARSVRKKRMPWGADGTAPFFHTAWMSQEKFHAKHVRSWDGTFCRARKFGGARFRGPIATTNPCLFPGGGTRLLPSHNTECGDSGVAS